MPFDPGQQYPARIEFNAIPVGSDALIAEHIAHSRSLGHTEAVPEPRTLRVIANGPSALQAPLDGPTLALNGALGMMLKRGVVPTFWAACDPQAMVVDFLGETPWSTTYLVASKCHPDVFERLRGHKVRIWHVDDVTLPEGVQGVRHTSTVTLTSMNLMRLLGWRAFEVWGWDGCFLDGKHHANETHPVRDTIECEIAGERFTSTHAWACEAEEAAYMLQVVDYTVQIKGDGMIAAYMKAMNL